MHNLYDLLGVRPDDDVETIKSAFRKAAKASHPDHHGGDLQAAGRFRQISLAYQILSDVEQRAAYDQQLEAQLRPSVEQQAACDRLLESELRPPHHKLKRSWSDIGRPVARCMTTGVLAIVLVVGYNLYDRSPKMPSDETAAVMARQSVSAGVRTAEDDKSEHLAAPQIPVVPVVIPAAREAAASAANDHDQEENANVEPASNPAGQPTAVAGQDSKSDIHASAGVPAKTEEGGPHVPHGAPSRGAPSTKMPVRAAATRDGPSRQLFTPAAPANPFEEFARQQERRNTAAVEERKRSRWCETGYC